MKAIVGRTASWLPTVFVLGLMLLAGSRLVILSLGQHADNARTDAREAAGRQRTAIEAQLSLLAERASKPQATRTSAATDTRSPAGPAANTAHGTFRIDADGGLVSSTGLDRAVAADIVREWSADEASDGASRQIGIVRQGSRWLVVARAPYLDAFGARAGWTVTWAELEALLAGARLGSLVDEGFDFTLAEVNAGNARTRPLVSSGPLTLENPVRATIRLPHGFEPAVAGTALDLVVRPSEGWYPASRIAAQIGLLALLSWLVAFATHDLLHRSRRLQEQLAEARRRQAALGDQLAQEIEQRQDLQKSFDHARYHDAFTGLPNRRYFMDQVDRALREVRARKRHGMALAVIDIDRFRLITETLGHAAGDELMVQAARRFERAVLGAQSVLARLEGSQFALLLNDVPTNEGAIILAARLQESLREPFELRRHRLAIAAHIGVSSTDSGLNRPEDLLREADIALSAAKRAEGNHIMAYAPALAGDAASLVSLEADLHLAIERKELRLLFQPIVDLRTGFAIGAEALLRWQHPVEGTLTPDRFLSIAEEAGLMVPITRWVISRVCWLAHDWRMRLPPGTSFFISVNLSAGALRDPHLGEFVAGALSRAQVPASTLKFEITEAGLIENVATAREVLRRLHDLGVQLMLDDFGTGYSSLNHLELFPFDFVKIDRPFVSRLGSEDANRGIIAAVVQIASSLGLKAIAEVIETQPVAQALQQMGCDFGQGYFFGVPVDAEETLHRLRGPITTAMVPQPVPTDDSPTLVLPVISHSRP